MDAKKIWIIVGVLVLLGLGYALYANSTPDAAPTETTGTATTTTETDNAPAPSEGSVTITYDGTTFSPSQVSVPVGTTVTWVNEGSGRMWVGSDDHPTHTHYDGSSTGEHCANNAPTSASVFDQCTAGTRYSFTFTKAGTWEYHNHANSRAGGTVVVTD